MAIELLKAPADIQSGLSELRYNQTRLSANLSKVTSDVAIPLENAEASISLMEGLTSSDEAGLNPLYGRVVGIIRRNWRQYAGILDVDDSLGVLSTQSTGLESNEETVTFHAVDARLPPIIIRTKRRDELSHQRVLVNVDSWESHSLYPQGHFVRSLGHEGDRDVESQILLHEFNVPYEGFSPEVMACLPPNDWRITDDIIAQRTDLRHLPIVSIDPPGCKDIDDALHCIRLPNGNLQLGVHIADVTFFVHPDTPLDKEAAFRSTSTYLVERRLDMLPSYLTTELCSLRSH